MFLENPLVILVVEDDHLVQSIVEEALTDGGFETVIASSGERAMELLDASEAKFRVLVTDINLGRAKLSGGRPSCQRDRSRLSYRLHERRQRRRLGL
jgi:CheY-like chemotaxis protein